MLGEAISHRLNDLLSADDAAQTRRYPGPRPGRQPVHTVFLSAAAYHRGVVDDWGAAAAEALEEFGPIPGFSEAEWDVLEPMVHEKLRTEPIEDLRIDLATSAAELSEADHADGVSRVARALAAGHADRVAPLSVGVRVPSLGAATRRQTVRTLDLLLDRMLSTPAGHPGRLGDVVMPDGFRITLPDARSVVQIVAMAELCEALEVEYGLPAGQLRFDIEVAWPRLLVAPDGTAAVAQMIHSARGRCAGLQYRGGDFAAAIGLAAPAQGGLPASADHARTVLQFAAAGTGIPVCDGAVEVGGTRSEDDVRACWDRHAQAVQRALERGIHRGTDVHPCQLASRFAATFRFYRHGLPRVLERLEGCLSGRYRGVLDTRVTLRALAGFLGRGLDCGAFEEDVLLAIRHPDGRAVDRAFLDASIRG